MDGTFAAGSNITIRKARTVALLQLPTKFFEDVIAKGRTSMVSLNDFTPLQGGVPIMVDGAVDVSGAPSAQQEMKFATPGAAALTNTPAMPSEVSYLDSQRVSAAFAKGMPPIEVGGYKIHARCREVPGQAEVHERDTDIVHVLGGSATLVTGGSAVNAKTIAPGEIRGATIKDGQKPPSFARRRHRSSERRAAPVSWMSKLRSLTTSLRCGDEQLRPHARDLPITIGTLPESPPLFIDVATRPGVALVRGEWQYADARVTETDFRGTGVDGQPTGAPVRTLTFAPPDQWETIAPASLGRRRGNGRLSFGWYRINVTVPDCAGDFGTAGSTIAFESFVDDYAEVWVDGELTRHRTGDKWVWMKRI